MRRDTTIRDRDRAAIRKLGLPCWLCGKPIDYSLKYPDPKCFVVDHKVPLARGGADERWNKAPAHRDCNRAKGARLDGGPVVKRSASYVFPTDL